MKSFLENAAQRLGKNRRDFNGEVLAKALHEESGFCCSISASDHEKNLPDVLFNLQDTLDQLLAGGLSSGALRSVSACCHMGFPYIPHSAIIGAGGTLAVAFPDYAHRCTTRAFTDILAAAQAAGQDLSAVCYPTANRSTHDSHRRRTGLADITNTPAVTIPFKGVTYLATGTDGTEYMLSVSYAVEKGKWNLWFGQCDTPAVQNRWDQVSRFLRDTCKVDLQAKRQVVQHDASSTVGHQDGGPLTLEDLFVPAPKPAPAVVESWSPSASGSGGPTGRFALPTTVVHSPVVRAALPDVYLPPAPYASLQQPQARAVSSYTSAAQGTSGVVVRY